MAKKKQTITSCKFCHSAAFGQPVAFRGTTERYHHSFFHYARCLNCDSICNLSITAPDYSNYVTGERASRLKVRRFTRFLQKLRIPKTEPLLDYGCGRGSLFLELRKSGYDVFGYEPFNKEYSRTLEDEGHYRLIYLTHVFEHLDDYSHFFNNIRKATIPGSLVITIHPSATRIPGLNASCKFQSLALHAPFHLGIPSDLAAIKLFEDQGFALKLKLPYDLQRSGFKDNGRVSALLFHDLGGTKEEMLSSKLGRKLAAALSSPGPYFYNMFVNTRDAFASTLVFERR